MKKKSILALAILLLAVLTLFSCGSGDEVELELGKTTTVGDYIQFTPSNVLVRASEMYAPKGHEDGWVYEGELKDQVYVVLTAKVKNLSDHNIKAANLAHVTLTQGDQEYTTGECMLLSENGTQLQRSGEIEAGDEGQVYILADGQETTRGQAQIKLTFTSSLYKGEEAYSLSCDTSKAVAAAVPLEKGKAVTAEGVGQITLNKASIGKRVNPSKASDTDDYAYYTPKGSDNLLLDAQLTVKNLQETACDAATFVGAVAVCDGEVNDSFVIVETDNGKDLKEKASVKVGKTKKIHALVNVPKEWKQKDVTLYIYFDGTEYEYTLKGAEK
ncbi:hypothetical protein LI177_07935 [bacterium 210820-DFI.6.37]|nr:hypothetical protein [bacterium 210820-DFI.6.37]